MIPSNVSVPYRLVPVLTSMLAAPLIIGLLELPIRQNVCAEMTRTLTHCLKLGVGGASRGESTTTVMYGPIERDGRMQVPQRCDVVPRKALVA
jgi:hypothetical protein